MGIGRPLSRRTLLRLAGFAAPALFAGCAGTATSPPPASPAAEAPPFEAVVVTTELVVGKNRFSAAMVDPNTGPIADAGAKLRFYKVNQRDSTAELRAELPATYRGEGLDGRGVYVAYPEFDESGAWGLEMLAPNRSGAVQIARTAFTVLRQSQTPPIGSKAPLTRQPLPGAPVSQAPICTAVPPCPMHETTVADAIAAGRPTVVLFSVPAYCTSQVCGPMMDIVLNLYERYRARAAFAHLEIYRDEQHNALSDAVREWRLTTEPWVFLVDASGEIRAKFEGGATTDEIEPVLAQMLA